VLLVQGGQFGPESLGQFAAESLVSLQRNRVVNFTGISSFLFRGNTKYGINALYTNGSKNSAFGDGLLFTNTTGPYNTGTGFEAKQKYTGFSNAVMYLLVQSIHQKFLLRSSSMFRISRRRMGF
jgi:hypothetical protein